MRREREVRRLFEQAGHTQHYASLRGDKRNRKDFLDVVEQAQQHPEKRYANRDRTLVAPYVAVHLDIARRDRDFFLRLVRQLYKLRADTILRCEDSLRAIARMARFAVERIREPETWKKASRNKQHILQSLAQHLFCKYSVPHFVRNAWMQNNNRDITLFIDLGQGARSRDTKACSMSR